MQGFSCRSVGECEVVGKRPKHGKERKWCPATSEIMKGFIQYALGAEYTSADHASSHPFWGSRYGNSILFGGIEKGFPYFRKPSHVYRKASAQTLNPKPRP